MHGDHSIVTNVVTPAAALKPSAHSRFCHRIFHYISDRMSRNQARVCAWALLRLRCSLTWSQSIQIGLAKPRQDHHLHRYFKVLSSIFIPSHLMMKNKSSIRHISAFIALPLVARTKGGDKPSNLVKTLVLMYFENSGSPAVLQQRAECLLLVEGGKNSPESLFSPLKLPWIYFFAIFRVCYQSRFSVGNYICFPTNSSKIPKNY